MWEGRPKHQDLKKLGCFSGFMAECVKIGSSQRGMLKEESAVPRFETNEWALTPDNVYISSRMNKDNLEALVEMSERQERNKNKICLPGVSVVHLRA